MDTEHTARARALPSGVLAWIHRIGWHENDITSFDFASPPIELKADFGDGMKHFVPNIFCTVTIQCHGEKRSEKFDMTVEGWKIDREEKE